ncbi:MAG: NAD(P)H-dependent oxidoreductase subunit E [Candidatus Rokubacteria bacterium]|nr:NAD(P)H-dependent oxidoreductase subunit E [Candidatus Rokubacteria bacterium]
MREALAVFPRERQWLLPALQAIQHAHGWLSREALLDVSAHLRVPASEVFGVASDYPELRLAPVGAHLVRVCTGVSCRLLGGDALLERVRERVRSGDVTVEAADCFFACSMAPLVEVDGAYRGRVALSDVDGLVDRPDVRLRPTARPAGTSDAVTSGATPATAAAALDVLLAAARSRASRKPAVRLLVGAGSCGLSVGAADVASALRDAVARDRDVEVVLGACHGMCYAAPTIEVLRRDAPRITLERVEPRRAADLVRALHDGRDLAAAGFSGVVWSDRPAPGLTPVGSHPFFAGQERVLLRRAGALDPESLDEALLDGAYRALAAALDGPPERVIDEVKASGLQGRGGAFFPAAMKWEACRKASGAPKYLVMNGEEGEPGIFKDRHLMEADPHQVLEGALLAAYAAGATHVVLYVHGEANLSASRLARAVADAEAAGIVGERMLGREPRCTVEIRRGGGGFVLGEETVLLESLEGRRAQPRTRPPFPVESGLWGRPTVINNVETLAAIPAIMARGAAAFASLGTPKAAGTKLFGLSGPIARPGVVETRNGVTLRRLLEDIGGGLTGAAKFLGAVVGGPSGSIVPAALFDQPMEPRERVSPGTGGIVAVPDGASVVDVVTTLLAFNARESCGKCTPCREGAPRLLAMIDELGGASGPAAANARALAETMQLASLCGLGQAAPLALLRALEEFPAAFESRTKPE